MSVAKGKDYREVVYTNEQWNLLSSLRSHAIELMNCLQKAGIYSIVHGSIARGDVHENSDIDIFIPYTVSYFLIVNALENCGFRIVEIHIVQATPNYVPKIYFFLDYGKRKILSYPLGPLALKEREFYKWGGELDYESLKKGIRVPGVNKDLILIIPTSKGHLEMPVIGNESYASQMIGVSIETIEERIRVLKNRREKGVTGLFVKKVLPGDADVLNEILGIARKNPFFRRRVKL